MTADRIDSERQPRVFTRFPLRVLGAKPRPTHGHAARVTNAILLLLVVIEDLLHLWENKINTGILPQYFPHARVQHF